MKPDMKARNLIFISYSHLDKRWCDRLQLHLQPLVRSDSLDLWADTRISPGSDWRREIDAAIATAKIAVLLVSGSFLASRFITEFELPKILERHEREGLNIFWIPVSASSYESTELERFQAAYNPETPLDSLKKANAEAALVEIARKIREALSSPGFEKLRETPETTFLRSRIDTYEHLRRDHPKNVQLDILDFFVEAKGSTSPPSSDSHSHEAVDVKPIWELLTPHLEERTPCFILADFGLGKSWLLQMIQYRLARAKLEDQSESSARWIPFYMNLQTYRRPAVPFSITSYLPFFGATPAPPSIFTHIRDKAWSNAYSESFLQSRRSELVAQFEAGHFLFLLDGIDEMRKEDAQLLLRETGELARAVHRSPVLLAGRRSYFRDPAEEKWLSEVGFKVFYLWPWSQDQLIDYLSKAHHAGVLSEPAEKVLSRLDATYGLRNIVSRALLAAMLVDQWDEIGSNTKIDMPMLYNRHIEKALLMWQAKRSWQLSMEQLRLYMEELAFLMFQLDVRSISGEELDKYFRAKFRELDIDRFSDMAIQITQDIQTNSFLLRHNTDYVFCHASFGDFLVARKLFRGLKENDRAPLSMLNRSKEYKSILDNFLIPMIHSSKSSYLIPRLYEP